MRSALQMTSSAPIEITTPPAAHDGDTGEAVAPADENDGYESYEWQQPDAEGTAAADAATTSDDGAQDETPPQAAENEDITLDIASMRDKRLRLNSFSDEDLQAVLLAKRNPDAMDLLDSLVKVHGRDAIAKRLGVAPAEVAPAAAAEVNQAAAKEQPVTIESVQDDIEHLDDEIFAKMEAFEFEEAATLRQELKDKRKLLTSMLAKQSAQEAPPADPQIAPEQFDRLYNADLAATTQEFPDMERDDSPLWIGMREEFERLQKAGDPIVASWDVNSQIARRVAQRLNLKPRAASAPAANTQVRTTPAARPGPAIGTRSSASATRQVDTAALKSLPTHLLSEALQRSAMATA